LQRAGLEHEAQGTKHSYSKHAREKQRKASHKHLQEMGLNGMHKPLIKTTETFQKICSNQTFLPKHTVQSNAFDSSKSQINSVTLNGINITQGKTRRLLRPQERKLDSNIPSGQKTTIWHETYKQQSWYPLGTNGEHKTIEIKIGRTA
jgi:hypothetical protein